MPRRGKQIVDGVSDATKARQWGEAIVRKWFGDAEAKRPYGKATVIVNALLDFARESRKERPHAEKA